MTRRVTLPTIPPTIGASVSTFVPLSPSEVLESLVLILVELDDAEVEASSEAVDVRVGEGVNAE